ncbi:MAG: peptidase [Anaerococcus vaginalis]|nr:peptidase [Anaerococcus vaginalis]MDU2649732.1 peptidase [Anaerococcus vaginalis]MDU4379584.1 peptidase [Anaerococcus vaginalis]MDU5342214.1 peptidase [Anaerococcus vaginalis]MDU5460835.1 peptidase [Anaerococcus vaginalis]MDU5825129.1 peptidase [Anaerococcus vaginalis]
MLNYPTELMPEIVSGTKNENAAYVFSDFYISNEDIEDSELSSIFETFAKGGIYKDCCFGNSCTHALVRQKKLMNRNIEKSEGITFIVGKLKEPYIVQVIG